MALTFTPRFGLIQWGAGTDAYTRDEANTALETIDELGAIDETVADAAALPAPGIPGRYIWQDDAKILWRDDGATLYTVRYLADAAPAALSPSTAGAPGGAQTQAHGDHGHSMLPWAAAADVAALTFGQARAAGVNHDKTVAVDHGHAMPTHTKADHDALRIDADTLDGLNSTDFAAAPPAGAVSMFAGAVPPGWLACDGATVARATYPNLFAAIGTTWGNGDGSGTTFSLPDLRGRSPLGAGTGPGLSARAVGDRGGAEGHAIAVGDLPAHNHAVTDGGHVHAVTDGGHVHAVTDGGHGHVLNDPGHGHGITDPAHNHGSGGHNHGATVLTQFVRTGTGANGLTATGVTVACDFDNTTGGAFDPNVGGLTGITLANHFTDATINNHTADVAINNHTADVAVNNHTADVATQNTGGGGTTSLMHPYAVVTFAVKA